ncbi:MAG: alpha/beta fold hydrolase [Myxococcota bacterium]
MKPHLDLNGHRHTASVWNAEAPGIAILALHGFTGSGADWAPLAESLDVPVLAPDLLGHGSSPAPAEVAPYRIDRVVDHVLAWCASRPHWIVMGYSMGGRVALRLAPALGDRLRGLVLVSTSPGIEDPAERAARATRDAELADAIETHGVPWFTERWSQHPLIRSQEQIPAAIRTPMQRRRLHNRATGLAGSLRGMGQGAVPPVWDGLGGIRAPTLWVTGADDPQYTRLATRGTARLANARHVVVADAGHCTHLEALGPTLGPVQRFVAAIGRLNREFDWNRVTNGLPDF